MTYVTDETNVNKHELLNVNLHFIYRPCMAEVGNSITGLV